MSDVNVIRYLLANSAPLTAVVGAAKIVIGEIRQGTSMPAILVNHISGVWGKQLAGQSNFCRARVQVTVQAADYAQQKKIMRLVRAAVPRTRGTIAGVEVEEILREPDGPDFSNSDAGIFLQTQDFMVSFNE